MHIEQQLDKNRVEAITDGIYAIAMTLGVLTINVSDLPTGAAGGDILRHFGLIFPQVMHYAIAFFVLISFWMAHHRQMSMICRVDSTYVWLNLVSLFFVATVPFTTDLMGTYSSSPAAVSFYAGNLFIIGLFASLAWFYATAKKRLVAPDFPNKHILLVRVLCVSVPAVSLVVILYAHLVSADYATLLFMLLPVVQKLIKSLFTGKSRAGSA